MGLFSVGQQNSFFQHALLCMLVLWMYFRAVGNVALFHPSICLRTAAGGETSGGEAAAVISTTGKCNIKFGIPKSVQIQRQDQIWNPTQFTQPAAQVWGYGMSVLWVPRSKKAWLQRKTVLLVWMRCGWRSVLASCLGPSLLALARVFFDRILPTGGNPREHLRTSVCSFVFFY